MIVARLEKDRIDDIAASFRNATRFVLHGGACGCCAPRVAIGADLIETEMLEYLAVADRLAPAVTEMICDRLRQRSGGFVGWLAGMVSSVAAEERAMLLDEIEGLLEGWPKN